MSLTEEGDESNAEMALYRFELAVWCHCVWHLSFVFAQGGQRQEETQEATLHQLRDGESFAPTPVTHVHTVIFKPVTLRSTLLVFFCVIYGLPQTTNDERTCAGIVRLFIAKHVCS